MMSMIRRNGHWLIGFAGMMCLAFAAGVMADRHPPGLNKPTDPAAAARGASDARELSAVFRQAAKEALPAIVSIETRGKALKVSGGRDMEEMFGDNSPFGEMFKRDPRLKEYFRNRNQGKEAPRSRGMGSGFIIDPAGVVMTNNHVVQDADQVRVKLSDGREYVAHAADIKTDPRSDVAIIRIHPEGELPAVKLGNSDSMEVGEWVLAVGSPFGLDLTVTAGIVSAKGRGPGITEREDFIQTDAAINPGNSGGPLINLDGEVIGMNTAISTRSGGYDGVGFAVPMNMARWVAEQLMNSGSVSRAYLGVAIQPVDNELARQFKVPVGQGALINQVMPDSPAASAKLEPGDLILKLDGKPVNSPRTLQGIVEQLKIGESYNVLIQRDGKELTLKVQMKEMPKAYFAKHDVKEEEEEKAAEPAHRKFEDLGLSIAELTPAIAKQLGYKTTEGVLVASVTEESPAATAGIREGMLIEKVGNVKVNTPVEFQEAISKLNVNDGVLLLVRTKAGTQYMVVRAEEAAEAK